MASKWIKSLSSTEDPEQIKKLVKKLGDNGDAAVVDTIAYGEEELGKLQALVTNDVASLNEDNILAFRKSIIALQLFARQVVGMEALAENMERIHQELILPLLELTGPHSTQALVTLKIDALSIYTKLLQAFEDLTIPFAPPILNFIVAQMTLHGKLFTGALNFDPFEAMTIRELYGELITQSVDVCCSMVAVSPAPLVLFADPLFDRITAAIQVVTDINCKYELVELLAQLCLLGLKSEDEKTEEEDFLDFQMRKIQAEDMKLHASQNVGQQAMATDDATAPLWSAKSITFEKLNAALQLCAELFRNEVYDAEDEEVFGEDEEDEEDGEEEMSGEEEDGAPKSKSKKPKQSAAPASSSTDTSTFESAEPVSLSVKAPSSQDPNKPQQEGQVVRKEESGAGATLALLSGLSNKCCTPDQHAQVFQLVNDTLSTKIATMFANKETYSRLPSLLDVLEQFISYSAPSLVAPHYARWTELLENIIKTTRIWKSEDPSPTNRRIYGYIRSTLLPCYSSLLRACPAAAFAQADRFMTVINVLLADPTVLADFASGLASIQDETARASARDKLNGTLLFQIVDSFLKELANPDASVNMKKTIIQCMGTLAEGTQELFEKMLPISVPILLHIGRDIPDLAPAAIVSCAQILAATRKCTDYVTAYLKSAVEQAVAMIFQDIIMSGLEPSQTAPDSSQITFNFASKARLQDDDEDEEEEEEEGDDIPEDNLADIVYKGQCFLAYIMHIPELQAILSAEDNGNLYERIFSVLLEVEEKPSLFEEDQMLKMTGVDILIYMVESISKTHTRKHQARALKAFKEADVDHFEEELEMAIIRLQAVKF